MTARRTAWSGVSAVTRPSSRYRVSSNFNPARRHPITGRVRPPRAPDFALPVGTVPSWPPGRRGAQGHPPPAGRYLCGDKARPDPDDSVTCTLSKLLETGPEGEDGDKIALSGNTGRSTGAHPHYEVRINNRPVDAMKVKLPMAEPPWRQGEAPVPRQGEELPQRDGGGLISLFPDSKRPAMMAGPFTSSDRAQ